MSRLFCFYSETFIVCWYNAHLLPSVDFRVHHEALQQILWTSNLAGRKDGNKDTKRTGVENFVASRSLVADYSHLNTSPLPFPKTWFWHYSSCLFFSILGSCRNMVVKHGRHWAHSKVTKHNQFYFQVIIHWWKCMNVIFHFCQVCSAKCILHTGHLILICDITL